MKSLKKKAINDTLRQRVALLLALFLVGSGGGFLWYHSRPLEKEEETSTLLYEQEAHVDYQVYFKPNDFFSELAQEPGKAYLANLTDYIQTGLNYKFFSQEETLIQGTYSVNATITAFTGSEKLKVWEKSFELLPSTPIYQRGKQYNLQEEIIIPYAQHAAFARNITEETGFTPEELNLVVTYSIDMEADTGSHVFLENLSPSLVIPLRGRVFTVEGNMAEESAREVTTSHVVPLPQVARARSAFGIAAGVLFVTLVFLFLFTESKNTKTSPAEKKISRILRKHSERIVMCKEKLPYMSPERTLAVKTFEDLVKVADEIGKPILFYQPEERESSFLVFNDNYFYRYTNDSVSPSSVSRLCQATLKGKDKK